MAAPARDEEAHLLVAAAVDADFYRALNPEIGAVEPVGHYVRIGWREGRDPAPWFSNRAYLAAYPDVAAADVDPLYHFLSRGWREGREAPPSEAALAWLYADDGRADAPPWRYRPPGASEPLNDAGAAGPQAQEREITRRDFDAVFYLTSNPDVAEADIDPLDHFLASGWREGRDPRPDFSVKEYLAANPDVAASDMNPFVHYLRAGRAEGRRGRNDLGFRFDILARQTPLQARVDATRAAQAAIEASAPDVLAAALPPPGQGLHLTFSHDDYVEHLGGVQLCLRRESAGIVALGLSHLHIYPAKPWPLVRSDREPGLLGVLIDGRRIGDFTAEAVVATLAARGGAAECSYAIHSLLGHEPDETAAIIEAAPAKRGWFWLHDFASLCAGFHLMRNDVEDCAAPPADSTACGVCVYGGAWRARHQTAHARLFERLAPEVVSPSQTTLDLWRSRWSGPPPARVRVAPHLRLIERGPAPPSPADRPFRLAFAGFPVAHKGWFQFRALVQRHADDRRYEFLHLGRHTPGDLKLAFQEVSVTETRPEAMREALEAAQVDAVLVWPLCRETFSLAAYEAAAAGAAVITGPDSGNVAAFVESAGCGVVLPGEGALAEAFATGTVLALSRSARSPKQYDLEYGALSADLLREGSAR